MDTRTTEDMRVWVGCLGCYNAGALVGDWVDALEAGEYEPHAAMESDTAARTAPCGRETADEKWCLDVEGPFLDHEMSPSEAQRIAEAVDALPRHVELDALASYLANTGESVTELDVDTFEDAYAGEWSSGADYAADLADQIGAVPDDASWPLSCIDWERAWRELTYDGYWISDAGHVFRS